MDARGTNKSRLARQLGITSQAVGQWGKPGGTMPTGEKLEWIASKLGVSVAELMSEVGTPFRDSDPTQPGSPPKVTRLVDQPDELALLEFWDDLPQEERVRVFRILRAAVTAVEKSA